MICTKCNTNPAENITFTLNGASIGPYCSTCWESIKICDICGHPHIIGDTIQFDYITGEWTCNYCAVKPVTECPSCHKNVRSTQRINGKTRCKSCSYRYFKCGICGKHHLNTKNVWETNPNSQLEYQDFFRLTVGGVCESCFNENTHKYERYPVRSCNNCGEYTINALVEEDGCEYPLCDKCITKLKKCSDCGDLVNYEITNNGMYFLCTKCVKEKYFYCVHCRVYHKKSEQFSKLETNRPAYRFSNVYVDEGVCKKCAPNLVQCSGCGKHCNKTSSSVLKVDEHYFCPDCDRSHSIGKCSVCKKISMYIERPASYKTYCRKCLAKELKLGHIMNYTYTPRLRFHGNGPLFMGFENETSFNEKKSVMEGLVYVYSNFEEEEITVKSDSSINQGFEIVSHPFDFKSLKKIDWSHLFPPDCRKHSSCGMHIHLNRNAFTTFHLYKFINFINDNPNFIRTIAQRGENHYTQAIDKSVKTVAKEKYTSTRYSKVNLNKPKTIELRFFAHAVTLEIFYKNIEFAQALYDFTLETSSKFSNSVTRFIKYVIDNKHRFNNLANFITKGE